MSSGMMRCAAGPQSIAYSRGDVSHSNDSYYLLLCKWFWWIYRYISLYYLRFCLFFFFGFTTVSVFNLNILGSFKKFSSLVVAFQIHEYVEPIDQVASESARAAFIIPECYDVPEFLHCQRRTLHHLNTYSSFCSSLPAQWGVYRKLMSSLLK